MDDVSRRRGRSLPHWSRPDGTYFLTFRTGDAIPAEVSRQLKAEYEDDYKKLTRELGHSPTDAECREIRTSRYRRAEKYLEEAHGACLIRNPRVAKMVDGAIRFFDRDRYRLHAWCLMPNHVHVLLTLVGGLTPTEVMGAWKSFTAKEINKLLGTTGPFWQEEGFDHLVRGPNSFERICRYIWENPRNLTDWPWVGGDGAVPEGWEER